MSKFHITEDGPRPCSATKRACPVGGEHFNHLAFAQAAYELMHGNGLESMKKEKLPKTVVTTTVKPFAGGRYFGCHVEKHTLTPHLEAWRAEIGQDRAAVMEELKAQRDRGYVYHLTVVTPPEMKQVGELTDFPPAVELTYAGVGCARDEGQEAWYVVCHAPELQQWREANGLKPKDFHITLGFEPKDVHTRPKGDDTIVLS